MPRILHLIPTLEGGGAERQLTMLATEQARRGWDVHVGVRRRDGMYEERMRNTEVMIHSLGDLRGLHPLLISRIGCIARRIKPEILQTWLPQMDLIGGMVAVLSSVPWVLSERSSQEAYRVTSPWVWVRRGLAQYAKAVVANSVEGAQYWKGVIRPEDVTTVYNAVDVSAIRSAAPTFSQESGSGNTLLFVGRLSQAKAPEMLIHAVACVPQAHDVRAVLIGDGPLRRSVCTRITECGLEERVTVLPSRANWWGLLKTCKALVSTSRFEGQPNVVLEAMAAGCPVIVSDIPAHRAVLDEESALIVPREDPTALASAIASLLSDPHAARQRAERASERVAGFTMHAAADAYERVYSRVLKRKTG